MPPSMRSSPSFAAPSGPTGLKVAVTSGSFSPRTPGSTSRPPLRPFIAGDDAPWIEDRRGELEGTYLRALELAAHASLRLGGGELNTAERSARTLVRHAPFRESGYRY